MRQTFKNYRTSRKEVKMTQNFDELQAAFAMSEEGQERALESAKQEWLDAVEKAIWLTAFNNYEFIVDQIWVNMPDGINTHEKRAMGPSLRRAAKQDWIEPTKKTEPSSQKNCHGNLRRVWRSKITEFAQI